MKDSRIGRFALALAALALILSACQPQAAPLTPTEPAAVAAVPTVASVPSAAEPLVFYCQVKDISAVFWQWAIKGCEEAAAELGPDKVELRVTTGTTDMGVEDSIKAFQDAVSAGADAIVIAPADSVALIPAVQEANEAGIPVAAMDTTVLPPAKLVTTVATDNFNGFMAAVKSFVEANGGKGTYALLTCPSTISTCRDITSGYTAAIEQFPDAVSVASSLATPDRAKGYNATRDFLIAHPDLTGVVAASGQDGLGAGEAIKDVGASTGVLTRNCTMEELQGVAGGSLSACFAQYPRMMGYRAVMALYDYIQGNEVPSYIDSGSDYVTPDVVQKWIDLGEFGGPPPQ